MPFFSIPHTEQDYICRGSFRNLDKEIRTSLIDSGMEILRYNEDDTNEWIRNWFPEMYQQKY